MFELTIVFKHEIIGFLPKFQRNLELKLNFELTMFELSISNLYKHFYIVGLLGKNQVEVKTTTDTSPKYIAKT